MIFRTLRLDLGPYSRCIDGIQHFQWTGAWGIPWPHVLRSFVMVSIDQQLQSGPDEERTRSCGIQIDSCGSLCSLACGARVLRSWYT